jgi:hypothetical protein
MRHKYIKLKTVVLVVVLFVSMNHLFATEKPVAGKTFTVGQNYPNPANYFTTIPIYNLKDNGKFQVFDLLGKKIIDVNVPAGTTYVEVNTADLPQGDYIYVIVIDSFKDGDGGITTNKMSVEHGE